MKKEKGVRGSNEEKGGGVRMKKKRWGSNEEKEVGFEREKKGGG